jgi:hypothetical protein
MNAPKPMAKPQPIAKSPQPLDDLSAGMMYGPQIAQPVPAINYLSTRYGIAPGRPTGLSGYAGSAKTFLAVDMALGVASGEHKCWGDAMTIEMDGRVVHLDYEMGSKHLPRRYQRLAYARGIDLARLQQQIGIRCFPKTNLTTDKARNAFLRLCDGVALCIIDSLRAAAPGVDESSSIFRRYIDMLSEVSEKTGTIFLLLIHEAKGNGEQRPGLQRMRGTSAIADALGAALSVGDSEGDILIEQTKASISQKGMPMLLRLVDVGDQTFDHFESLGLRFEKVDLRERQDAKRTAAVQQAKQSAIDVLAKHGALGAEELRKRMRGDKAVRAEAIRQLEAEGKIARPSTGKLRPYTLAAGRPRSPVPALSVPVSGTTGTPQ